MNASVLWFYSKISHDHLGAHEKKVKSVSSLSFFKASNSARLTEVCTV